MRNYHLFFLPLMILCIMEPSGSLAQRNREDLFVLHINQDLLQGADAIVRYDHGYLDIKNEKQASYDIQQALTILNEDGRHLGEIRIFYDQFTQIRQLNARIYNSLGELVRYTKSDEIKDYALSAGSSGYTDNRVKILKIFHNDYPYTIEIDLSYHYNGLIAYPPWKFIVDERVAVEESQIAVEVPQGFEIDYMVRNIQLEPEISYYNNKTIYTWLAEDLRALDWEPMMPHKNDISPMLYIKPSHFQIDQYSGKNESWESIGKFYEDLNSDRDALSEEHQQEIQNLVAGIEDTNKLIRKLYRYLQENTRYVSIQLGIGGWQCFDADFVHDKKYGDCKALTNYMKTLLKIAGIDSYPVLVNAGRSRPDMLTDFPVNQFNHVILCVPLQNDTIWLECTSQSLPCGYLGSFTSDRHALFCRQNGGKLIRTPGEQAENNTRSVRGSITLDEEGNAAFSGKIIFKGNSFVKPMRVSRDYDQQQTFDWFRQLTELPSFRIDNLAFGQYTSMDPVIDLAFDLDVENIAATTMNRLFFCPNVIEHMHKYSKDDKRIFPVKNKSPYVHADTIKIALPQDFHIESMPGYPVNIESGFGSYTADCNVLNKGDSLIYTRSLKVNKFEYPAEKHAELVEFFNSIAAVDRYQMVLKKNN